MDFSEIRVLESFFCLLKTGIIELMSAVQLSQNTQIIKGYIEKWILLSINWTFCGDLFLVKRYEFFRQSLILYGELLNNMELP